MLVPRCSKQWQQCLVASDVDMELWRADCLSSCSHRWQGDLVLACHGEAQARAVATSTTAWQGEALARVARGQQWKLQLVADLKEQWQVAAVMEESREMVAKLLSTLLDKSRVEGVLACSSLVEWKLVLLGKSLEDWKFLMLLSVLDEEKAILIEKCKSQLVCSLLASAKESWRLNALTEAASGGFWLAELVARVKEEWQARLVLLGHRDKVEQWRLHQLPDITQVCWSRSRRHK